MLVGLNYIVSIVVNMLFVTVYVYYLCFTYIMNLYKQYYIYDLFDDINEIKKELNLIKDLLNDKKNSDDLHDDLDKDLEKDLEEEDLEEDKDLEEEDLDEDLDEDLEKNLEEEDLDEDLEEEDGDLEEIDSIKKVLLPMQNHILFSFNNLLEYETDETNEKVYIISNQLCKFLKKEKGSITKNQMNELKAVLKYIKKNKLIKNNEFIMDISLRKLFGITENEDYELTTDNIMQFLKPHFVAVSL